MAMGGDRIAMNGGEGQTSYAYNSVPQRRALYMIRPLVEEAMLKMCSTTIPESFTMADLACACGPNTLLLTYTAIDAIHKICRGSRRPSPELKVFLNDLPDNDFNTVFRDLPAFYKKLHEEKGDEFGPCLIYGAPGSFYGRLFSKRSLHFACSSFGVQWLSQVPEELKNKQVINIKGNIYLDKSSPPPVFGAYLKQFQQDFTLFLKSRSEEIVPCGHMILTLMGRKIKDPFSDECSHFWQPVLDALKDILLFEGLIKEASVDPFNLAFYGPHIDELKDIVQLEGSFSIDRLEERGWWDLFNGDSFYDAGKTFSGMFRAVLESALVSHFGSTAIHEVFERVEMNLSKGTNIREWAEKQVYLVVSLTRKA